MRRFRLRMGLFSLLTLGIASSAFGSFDITPMKMTLEPSGQKTAGTYTVRNLGGGKIPIQLTIIHRIPDKFGKEDEKETSDIDDLFQVYPSQLILGPNESRSIRVAWIGDSKVPREQSFRMVAEELPFTPDQPEKTNKVVGRVSLSLRYVGALYVKPPGATSRLVVLSAVPAPHDPSKLELTVQNQGTVHQMMEKLKVRISAGATPPILLPRERMGNMGGENILSGSTRVFTLPWPSGFSKGSPLKVEISASAE